MKKNDPRYSPLARAYKNVFLGSSTAQEGMMVLTDLINISNIFTTNTKSAHEAAVLEGKRAVGVYIFGILGLAPDYGGEIDLIQLGNITQIFAETAHNITAIQQAKHDAKEEDDA